MKPFETLAFWETILKVKNQIADCKKILSICVTDNDLISRVYNKNNNFALIRLYEIETSDDMHWQGCGAREPSFTAGGNETWQAGSKIYLEEPGIAKTPLKKNKMGKLFLPEIKTYKIIVIKAVGHIWIDQ